MDWSSFRNVFGKSPPGTPRHPALPEKRESSSCESFGRTVTQILPGHHEVAEGPAQESFLSGFESLPVKCNKTFGELTIGLPKGTNEYLAEQLAELVRRELEAKGLIGEIRVRLLPSLKRMSKIDITDSGIRINGIKEGAESAARDLAARFLHCLIKQCAFLGITDESRFKRLAECDSLPSALGRGSLDFIGKTIKLDDGHLFHCIVDALRLDIQEVADLTFDRLKIILVDRENERERGRYGELPAVVTSAAWAAMHDGHDAFLFELVPIVGKVDREGGLDLLAKFCRRYPARAALPSLLLPSKKAKKLHTAIASRAIHLALRQRNYLEAGELLAAARRRKLAPSLDLDEEGRALVEQCGFDLGRMGGASACDLLILVLCAPKLRLLQTAWGIYKAHVRAGGRPAAECTQALFQSFNKDLLPGESRKALTVARTPRGWGLRFVEVAENAAARGDFKLVSRYMEFVAVLCSCERDLLDRRLPAVVELLVAFPNLLKNRKFVRLIRERLLIEDERQPFSRLDKADRAARFGAQLLGTDDWDHGISFERSAPDDRKTYNSFDHAMKAIKLAEDRFNDSDLDGQDALLEGEEIMNFVILRALVDTKEQSEEGKRLASDMMLAIATMVTTMEESPAKEIAARGLELREFIQSSGALTMLLEHALGVGL